MQDTGSPCAWILLSNLSVVEGPDLRGWRHVHRELGLTTRTPPTSSKASLAELASGEVGELKRLVEPSRWHLHLNLSPGLSRENCGFQYDGTSS